MCLVASSVCIAFTLLRFRIREASDAEGVGRGMQKTRVAACVGGWVGWWLSGSIAAASVACKLLIVSIKITNQCLFEHSYFMGLLV